jgi:hypothetical protein
MMAKNNMWECADPGARGVTQLEVECLKGYGTIKCLGTTGLDGGQTMSYYNFLISPLTAQVELLKYFWNK